MLSSSRLFIVKFGGSLITDKHKPYVAKRRVIGKLARVIKTVYTRGTRRLLLGHGAGSFAHIDAKNYKTIEGIVDKESLYGAARVKYVALKLHELVLNEFLQVGLPVFSFSPASLVLSSNFADKELFVSPLLYALRFSLIPFFYGDVVIDKKRGFTIFSTEKVISLLVKNLKARGFKDIVAIYLGNTRGVLDNKGKTIKELNSGNLALFRDYLSKAATSYDVTGGMQHKVEQAFKLAKLGVPTVIGWGEDFNADFFANPFSQPNTTVVTD